MDTSKFEHFAFVLKSSELPKVRDDRLLIEKMDKVAVYYAPFEYTNPAARIVLVGITPGPTQMVNANLEARRALLSGDSHERAMYKAKQIGGFSGEPMRGNLIKQLDHWRINEWLSLKTCAELFGASSYMLQSTSLLRYPVFVEGNDYRGTPDMLKHPLLRKCLTDYFVKEVNALNEAVFLPLGPQVRKVLDSLVSAGVLNGNRIVRGLLHPSGNCTYRINWLTGPRQTAVPHATNPVPYDQGRIAFSERYL